MRGNSIFIALAVAAVPVFAAAQIGAQATKQIQAAMNTSFVSGSAPSMGQAPDNAAARIVPVSVQSPEKGVATFKQAADLLAMKGAPKVVPTSFCAKLDLSCDAQGWPVKSKGTKLEKDVRNAVIGSLAGSDTVVLYRQDNDKVKGELYVCDPFGNLIRGYVTINNGMPTRIPADQAKLGFESEKKWWMNWLPDNAVVAAETTASAK